MMLTCNGAIKVVKWWCSSASVVPKYDGDDEVPYVMLYTSANKVPTTGAKSCNFDCASEVPYGMLYAIAKPVV